MMNTRYPRGARDKRPVSPSAGAQEEARAKMWENIAGYGTILFFILFFVGSIPFGYDPPKVLLFIIATPLLIAAVFGTLAFFLAVILSLLR
jgi:hypothetical protein